MRLSTKQLKIYEEQGFVLLPNWFSQLEVDIIKSEVSAVLAQDTSKKVIEKDGKTIRSLLGPHLNSEFLGNLSQHPRLIEPAMQMIGSEVYVHAFRIHFKAAFEGEVWTWHQDYAYWDKVDGVPTPQATTIIIFLDEVNEFNSPLFLIPGSHKECSIDLVIEDNEPRHSNEQNSPTWASLMTTTEKYSTDKNTVARLASRYGLESAKGAAGTVLCIHPQCVHGSASNISPFKRNIAVLAYNSVENTPFAVDNPRPEFITGRNYTPIKPLSEEILLRS